MNWQKWTFKWPVVPNLLLKIVNWWGISFFMQICFLKFGFAGKVLSQISHLNSFFIWSWKSELCMSKSFFQVNLLVHSSHWLVSFLDNRCHLFIFWEFVANCLLQIMHVNGFFFHALRKWVFSNQHYLKNFYHNYCS